MKNKILRGLICLALLCSLLATPALARPTLAAEPDGPFITDTQAVKLESYYSYEELVKALKLLEHNSQGEARLQVIGQSNLGRDIYMVSVGHGENNVVIVTQQHGNEPHGTQAVLDLLKILSSSGRPEFVQIRDNLTVNIVPRLNPDGCEAWQRYNVDPNAPNPRNYPGWEGIRLDNEKYGMYSSTGVGWDLNRFNFIDWTTSPMYQYFAWPENPGTEAAILAQVMANMEPTPLWFIDVHNQGSTVDPEGTLVSFALDTAHMTNDWVTDLTYPLVQESAQMLVVVWDRAHEWGQVGVTRYGKPSAYPGRSRNQYMQVLGVPGILIEMRGMGQKNAGRITMLCRESLLAVIKATADGSLYDVDWTRIAEIPQGTDYWKELP